jgi:hypothetical protein
MAGPSIGTWVKVKNKSGRMTARVIPNKYGGGSYSQGQVITQSEFQKVQERRAEAKKAKGEEPANKVVKFESTQRYLDQGKVGKAIKKWSDDNKKWMEKVDRQDAIDIAKTDKLLADTDKMLNRYGQSGKKKKGRKKKDQ